MDSVKVIKTKNESGSPTENPVESKKESKPNAWTNHVKSYCIENGISYREALRSDECKKLYRESKSR